MGSDGLSARILSIVLLVILTLFFGLIPLCLRRYLRSSPNRTAGSGVIISYLNCFAGGVFMGTAFTHLLPDTHSQLQDISGNFPFPEFVAGCGFFLVMILERAFIACCGNAVDDDSTLFTSQTSDSIQKYGTFDQSTKSIFTSGRVEKPRSDGDAVAEASPVNPKPDTGATSLDNNDSESSKSPQPDQCHSRTVHSIRALVLLFALSLHTVFEGLALGLMESTSAILQLLLAISIHKCIIAFTLGLQLDQTQSRCRGILFMVLFALMSPLGIGIGIGVTNLNIDSYSKNTTEGVLQGIATGTFLYVTFFEVLQRELGNDNDILKVIPAILGFGVMSALVFLE